MRKFEILEVILVPGGPGPEYSFKVKYKAIRKKVWVNDWMWFMACNEKEARHKAEQRYGDK